MQTVLACTNPANKGSRIPRVAPMFAYYGIVYVYLPNNHSSYSCTPLHIASISSSTRSYSRFLQTDIPIAMQNIQQKTKFTMQDHKKTKPQCKIHPFKHVQTPTSSIKRFLHTRPRLPVPSSPLRMFPPSLPVRHLDFPQSPFCTTTPHVTPILKSKDPNPLLSSATTDPLAKPSVHC